MQQCLNAHGPLSLSTDVESVMNSIVSLLLILETDKQEALIESLCEKLVKFREGERPSLRMQLLVPSSPFPENFQNKRLLIYLQICNLFYFLVSQAE